MYLFRINFRILQTLHKKTLYITLSCNVLFYQNVATFKKVQKVVVLKKAKACKARQLKQQR